MFDAQWEFSAYCKNLIVVALTHFGQLLDSLSSKKRMSDNIRKQINKKEGMEEEEKSDILTLK